MEYTIEIQLTNEKTGRLANDAHIKGLKSTWYDTNDGEQPSPDTWLHFAHHDFDYVWNKETGRQERRDVNKFYGGMCGEGSSHDTWQDALLCSLYDLYQTNEGLHKGDTFVATYLGVTQRYICEGFHVLPITAAT